MSDTNPCPGDGGNEVAKCSLPPWMNSEMNSSHRKKPKQTGGGHDVSSVEAETAEGSASPCSNNSKFSNLMVLKPTSEWCHALAWVLDN